MNYSKKGQNHQKGSRGITKIFILYALKTNLHWHLLWGWTFIWPKNISSQRLKALDNSFTYLPIISKQLHPQLHDVPFHNQVLFLSSPLGWVGNHLNIFLNTGLHLNPYSYLSHSIAAGVLIKFSRSNEAAGAPSAVCHLTTVWPVDSARVQDRQQCWTSVTFLSTPVPQKQAWPPLHLHIPLSCQWQTFNPKMCEPLDVFYWCYEKCVASGATTVIDGSAFMILEIMDFF